MEEFTKQMRKATREQHAASDALVNAKLVFALSNNNVWAEGLLVFYEVFRYLEEAMATFKTNNLGKLNIEGMSRTAAFERDLAFYLGADWKKSYKVRESVARYLTHLHAVAATDTDLLMAYVYHLYMGLFSGGQVLRKKRTLQRKLFLTAESVEGESVTDFGEHKISELKRDLARTMNEVAETLSEETKRQLIAESKRVFEWNNTIIRSVPGTGVIVLRKLLLLVVCLVCVLICYLVFVG